MGKRCVRGGIAACLFSLLVAAPAMAKTPVAGAELTGSGGCKGTASSRDADGAVVSTLDTAAGIPPSKDDPFVVDPDGSITYEGSSTALIQKHTWEVQVAGVPVKSGSGDNDAPPKKATSGTIQVSDYFPVSVTGTVFVDGSIAGQGGECSGSVWVKIDGNPFTSVNGLAGIGFALLGILGLVFALPHAAAGAARA